ncbi:hypothetical protein EK21DRAFT_92617 [Setomelanomma holmii]|uniref:Uncharacterized protein n=1 Tax=Setomelanomma holmii TaxID=210430 RepID=A0A9P4LGY3_9PLEO|nr:hypothetical protein EK21DRAFT_92617 [Setomelanomma holmii]
MAEHDALSQPEAGSVSRPVRSHTAVDTYNLKVLNGNARHTRTSHLSKQTRHNNQSMDSALMNTDLSDETPPRHAARGSTSSSPSSLSASPSVWSQMDGQDNSLCHITRAAAKAHRATQHSTTQRCNSNITQKYDCFNQLTNPRGHYYSARELYSHGVWVGYLAPDRQNKSYHELPSYNELKANYNAFRLPFPPSAAGKACVIREAVCRSCLGSASTPITMVELPFIKNRSIAIMPLDGDDDLFCIMLPRSLDRSHKALQTWRPYETRNGGDGKTFDNNFFLLTLRNTNRDLGTVEALRYALDPQEDTEPVSAPRPIVVLKANLQVNPDSASLEPLPRSRSARKRPQDSLISTDTKVQPKHQRKRLNSVSPSRAVSGDTMDHTGDETSDSPSNDIAGTEALATREQEPTPGPSIASETCNGVRVPGSENDSGGGGPLSARVRFIWRVSDDGFDYDFLHTMAECDSFAKLLAVLQDDVEHIPTAADLLARTTTWRLSYCSPNGMKRAVVTRKGTEVQFKHLVATLEKQALETGDTSTVDIELKAMA